MRGLLILGGIEILSTVAWKVIALVTRTTTGTEPLLRSATFPTKTTFPVPAASTLPSSQISAGWPTATCST